MFYILGKEFFTSFGTWRFVSSPQLRLHWFDESGFMTEIKWSVADFCSKRSHSNFSSCPFKQQTSVRAFFLRAVRGWSLAWLSRYTAKFVRIEPPWAGKPFLVGPTTKPWPNEWNIAIQHRSTLLNATCWTRLAAMLHHVASWMNEWM